MAPICETLLDRPILFAHRGASAYARENTLEAFVLALSMGASGLESDVFLTRDRVAVLDHDGKSRFNWWRRRPILGLDADMLPAHIPALSDLFDRCGTNFELSLDIKDPSAIEAVTETIRSEEQAAGRPLTIRTWLCTPELELAERWKDRFPGFRVVHSTRLARTGDGPERHGATLASAGIDAVNFRYQDWTAGLVALYHRFEIVCFAWDAHLTRVATDLLHLGLDGVYGNYVDRLQHAMREVYGD